MRFFPALFLTIALMVPPLASAKESVFEKAWDAVEGLWDKKKPKKQSRKMPKAVVVPVTPPPQPPTLVNDEFNPPSLNPGGQKPLLHCPSNLPFATVGFSFENIYFVFNRDRGIWISTETPYDILRDKRENGYGYTYFILYNNTWYCGTGTEGGAEKFAYWRSLNGDWIPYKLIGLTAEIIDQLRKAELRRIKKSGHSHDSHDD